MGNLGPYTEPPAEVEPLTTLELLSLILAKLEAIEARLQSRDKSSAS